MNINHSILNKSEAGIIHPANEGAAVYTGSALIFLLFHVLCSLITVIHSGINAMFLANTGALTVFALIMTVSGHIRGNTVREALLITALFVDMSLLYVLSGGTTGSAIYMAVPAIISGMLVLPLRIRPVIPVLWTVLFAGLFTFQYYHPEYMLSHPLFFDGFFDTVMAVLFGIASSGVLIIVYSRSGEEIRARCSSIEQQAEARRMEFETYSLDFPIRINRELSGILSGALSPLNSALKGEFGKRISRAVLASVKADTERARLYLQNMKYMALLEHGITEHFSLAVDLDELIVESSQEFHEIFGYALPQIISEDGGEIQVSTCETCMLRLGILNILRICTPGRSEKSRLYINVYYTGDTATITFSAEEPEEESFIAGLFEIPRHRYRRPLFNIRRKLAVPGRGKKNF